MGEKKRPVTYVTGHKFGNALLSHTLVCSTIGERGLNFCVRNGNRCDPSSIVTKKTVLLKIFLSDK